MSLEEYQGLLKTAFETASKRVSLNDLLKEKRELYEIVETEEDQSSIILETALTIQLLYLMADDRAYSKMERETKNLNSRDKNFCTHCINKSTRINKNVSERLNKQIKNRLKF
jgi:hypothetical protein